MSTQNCYGLNVWLKGIPKVILNRHIKEIFQKLGPAKFAQFFLLEAYSAGLIAIIFCCRIVTAYFYPAKLMALVFLIIAFATSAYTFAGWTSVLAFLGTANGTLATFQKDNRRMRLQFLIASGFWLIHNLIIWSPIAALQEIAISSSNLLGLWRFHRDRSNKLEVPKSSSF